MFEVTLSLEATSLAFWGQSILIPRFGFYFVIAQGSLMFATVLLAWEDLADSWRKREKRLFLRAFAAVVLTAAFCHITIWIYQHALAMFYPVQGPAPVCPKDCKNT